jgi:preprotein translocase subunit YajC
VIDNLLLLAQTAVLPAGAPAQNQILGFLPMIAVIAIFYLIVFAPMRKRQKKVQAMLSQLKKGDEVITNGGIYGRVSAVDESNQTVILQVADSVKIKISRNAIAALQGDPKAAEALEAK